MMTTKTKGKPAAPQPEYSPSAEERAAIDSAFEARKIDPASRLKVENGVVSIDHPDELIGYLLTQNALGSLDASFVSGILEQLTRASSRGREVSQSDLNFMVSVVKGIEPRDQLESMLAAQMASIHIAMMKICEQIGRVENLPQQDSAQRAFNQLARTFVTQMEALKRYRSGGEKVTVQNVSVSEGGQAIVGNVTQNPRETAADSATSSAPVVSHSQRPAMELVGQSSRKVPPVRRKLGK